ncbi:hypothetical protein AB0C59_32615 [Streptomyces sp. NPDC048664]
MSASEKRDTPQVDEETRERSAEQRTTIAPTPPDVRAEGDDPEPPPTESK